MGLLLCGVRKPLCLPFPLSSLSYSHLQLSTPMRNALSAFSELAAASSAALRDSCPGEGKLRSDSTRFYIFWFAHTFFFAGAVLPGPARQYLLNCQRLLICQDYRISRCHIRSRSVSSQKPGMPGLETWRRILNLEYIRCPVSSFPDNVVLCHSNV